jgi:hypothetical protein
MRVYSQKLPSDMKTELRMVKLIDWHVLLFLIVWDIRCGSSSLLMVFVS